VFRFSGAIANSASRGASLALLAGALACLLWAGSQPAAAGARRPAGDDVRVVKAAGVRQQLDCRGSGPVTLLVITGLAGPASTWSIVAAGLRRIARTCFYDRPGIGKSPPRAKTTQVVDAGLYARELSALLRAAGEPGPYVVLGHSFGGLVARAFTFRHMSAVRGVLLAEGVDPGDQTTGRYWHEAGHAVDMALSRAAAGGGPNLGHRPLLVLSASHPEEDHLGGPTYGQPAWMIDQWIAEQRADVQLSSNSIQVIATSGHVLQQDAPKAVVEAARLLVHAVAHGDQLACSRVWSSVAATCR